MFYLLWSCQYECPCWTDGHVGHTDLSIQGPELSGCLSWWERFQCQANESTEAQQGTRRHTEVSVLKEKQEIQELGEESPHHFPHVICQQLPLPLGYAVRKQEIRASEKKQ